MFHSTTSRVDRLMMFAVLGVWSIRTERTHSSRNKYKVHGRQVTPRRRDTARQAARKLKIKQVDLAAS